MLWLSAGLAPLRAATQSLTQTPQTGGQKLTIGIIALPTHQHFLDTRPLSVWCIGLHASELFTVSPTPQDLFPCYASVRLGFPENLPRYPHAVLHLCESTSPSALEAFSPRWKISFCSCAAIVHLIQLTTSASQAATGPQPNARTLALIRCPNSSLSTLPFLRSCPFPSLTGRLTEARVSLHSMPI